ncbi:MAG: copper transporter [Solirubrobacteraceae bacterium]
MFDFRYHAMSLAAVFIALIVGLLLGVAIGDKELVSSARTDIRDSIRSDVNDANAERDQAKEELADERQFGEKAFPLLTGGRLRGREVGLVMLGPVDVEPDAVRKWLEPSGASLSLVAELREEVDIKAIGKRARGTRYEDVAAKPELLGSLARRVGIQLVRGGRLAGRLRSSLLQTVSGDIGGLDGVIVVRPSQPPADEQVADRLSRMQDGLVRGLAQTGVKVVGIEQSAGDESQISWYRDRELSTIDNVDETAGQAALVFVLAGADGAFGRRDSAQDLLPPVVATAPRTR